MKRPTPKVLEEIDAALDDAGARLSQARVDALREESRLRKASRKKP